MEIFFKNTHESVTQRQLDRTERRLRKLVRFIDESKLEAHAYVEIGRASGAHSGDDVWQAVINVDAQGTRYRAEEVSSTPERAANAAMDEIRVELRRAHAKEKMLRRRQHSVWKSLHNFGTQ